MCPSWDEVRKDFPALQRRVYLNSAATGLPPPSVRAAVDRFYRELEEGGDVHWDDWMERREQVRARVAALIGAEAEEIAFAPNTSTGMNLIAERIAIESYADMARYFGDKDPTTRRMIEGILANEEEHADDLSSLLATLDPSKG